MLEERDSVGEAFHELYIPYRSDGRVAAAFELYEPAAKFDALVWKVVRPVLIIPLTLFVITLSALAWLVSRAQADIDLRNTLVMSLRQRLESLVSARAVAAMHLSAADHMKPEKLNVTLLYSDVRGFSGFAEQHSPEEVIDFLNRVIGLQVEIIETHGGDIDKMIGDAVLARFDGSDRAINAIDSAVAIQKKLSVSRPSCRVGIGLFDGPVVAGLIGGGNRFDYTVVGDSVNNAARLCGLAKPGEIIADSVTAENTRGVSFGPEETVRVKGRRAQLTIRRLSPEEIDEKGMTG
jgi:class 3 adenylate cyclase